MRIGRHTFGDHTVIESDVPVPVGESHVGVRFRRTGNGATATLVIGDEPAGAADIPFVMRVISAVGSSVGLDHGNPVSRRYESPFTFEGELRSLDITLVSADRAEEREVASADGRSAMGRQ